jgi:formate hydrogenlyase subunit 4
MTALLQVVLIVALAPLIHGAMKRLRANLQGRPGPSPLQPYRDIRKLWRKEALLPTDSSVIARIAPGVSIGVAVTFAVALPVVSQAQHGGGVIDVIALAFLLGIDRFMLALAALGTRSAFAAMASSREMTFGSLIEPALLVALLGGAALSGDTSISLLLGQQFGLAGALAFAAFFLVMLAETSRIPIDNQETHYELTMIHEGLELEYSGWMLAMLQIASQIRQVCFMVLASMLLPGGLSLWTHLPWIVAMMIAVTTVETLFAKVRLFEVPQLLGSAFILAATSVGLRLIGLPL